MWKSQRRVVVTGLGKPRVFLFPNPPLIDPL